MEELKELNETVELMLSLDYKERFRAEYWQTKIRYQKLHKTCIKMEAKSIGIPIENSLEILLIQKSHMGQYLHDLEIRAEIEGIEL